MMKEALVSICSLLNKHEVDYMVIGGVAVIFHGYTRATADLDFWYKPSLNNFHKIVKAFKEYGFDVSDFTIRGNLFLIISNFIIFAGTVKEC